MFVTSFLGGVQLFILGVVGVYLSRVYEEVKGRPLCRSESCTDSMIVREARGAVSSPTDGERLTNDG